jgi:hypothetical protein
MLIFTENINTKKIYGLIHIPKNSGRYMRTQISNKFIITNKINDLTIVNTEIKNNLFFVPCHNDGDIVLPAHTSYHQFKKYNINIDIFFAFTRNPYDRFISGYLYCLELNILKLVLKSIKLTYNIHFVINEEEEYSKDSLLSYSNDEFIEKLKTFIKIMKELVDNNYLIHPIFKPQYKFLLEDNDNESLCITNNVTIYKLEDYETNIEAQSFFKFEGFNIKKYNYSDYYDDECVSLINEVYQKDFELFDYKKLENIE